MNRPKDLTEAWITWLNRFHEQPTDGVPVYSQDFIIAVDNQVLLHDFTQVCLVSQYLDLESDVRNVHLVGIFVGDELRAAMCRIDNYWHEFFANGLFMNLPETYVEKPE